MLVLAFDPGYGRLGWGLVRNRKERAVASSSSSIQYEALGCGTITTKSDLSMPVRLHEIYKQSSQLIEKANPDLVAIEKLYFSRNRSTAAGVYQAQGVLLAASGAFGVSLLQLEPSRIKKALTGSGEAGKQEIMRMVCRILHIGYPIRPDDTADALAIAIAGHLTLQGIESRIIPKSI